MRRCTACFRFHPGAPTYCGNCGRTFSVRLCERGHRNPRAAQFCSECGSAELSQAAPAPSILYRLSGAALYAVSGLAAASAAAALVGGLLYAIDWPALSGPLAGLLLALAFLYWTTTLLPGPVRKVGKAAAAAAMKGKGRKGPKA